MKKIITIILLMSFTFCKAQDANDFETFRNSILKDFSNERVRIFSSYQNFRDSINSEYVDFLRKAWGNYCANTPLITPKEKNPIPPKPYSKPIEETPISIIPDEIPIIESLPKPNPIEPIKNNPKPTDEKFNFAFFGLKESVRLPKLANISIDVSNINNIAEAWNTLCVDDIDNTIYDILALRDKYNLCDWAYLLLIDAICKQFCADKNGRILLMAFLYCQSGYQMRLAKDDTNLYLLYGSQHIIFDKGYYEIDGVKFYPFQNQTEILSICPAEFEGEKPLSLIINSEQKLGNELSPLRNIKSYNSSGISANSHVPVNLIKFYNEYPTSAIGENPLTRWAMYANTPLAEKTKEVLYPELSKFISVNSKLEATSKLLNWVQTGFEYEYDDRVWGHDRAFFAEETLFYPYADCEDRSILFSRLVRDLLGLDVALVYYPGHLATAVCFEENVNGDVIMIDNKRFTVCDPTYIGAPVGAQMPDLDYDKAQAIVLLR